MSRTCCLLCENAGEYCAIKICVAEFRQMRDMPTTRRRSASIASSGDEAEEQSVQVVSTPRKRTRSMSNASIASDEESQESTSTPADVVTPSKRTRTATPAAKPAAVDTKAEPRTRRARAPAVESVSEEPDGSSILSPEPTPASKLKRKRQVKNETSENGEDEKGAESKEESSVSETIPIKNSEALDSAASIVTDIVTLASESSTASAAAAADAAVVDAIKIAPGVKVEAVVLSCEAQARKGDQISMVSRRLFASQCSFSKKIS